MISQKRLQLIVQIAAILLGLFFVYAGGKKLFLPPAPRGTGPSTLPPEFIDLLKALSASGYFMVMVAWFQLCSGILLLFRKTHVLGALLLLPVTFNIFVIHVALDNRIYEYFFTGFLLLVNVTILIPHLNKFLITTGKPAEA